MSKDTHKPLSLPPAVESEIPEEDEAAAEYYDTHDFAALAATQPYEVFDAEPEPVGTLEIA